MGFHRGAHVSEPKRIGVIDRDCMGHAIKRAAEGPSGGSVTVGRGFKGRGFGGVGSRATVGFP